MVEEVVEEEVVEDHLVLLGLEAPPRTQLVDQDVELAVVRAILREHVLQPVGAVEKGATRRAGSAEVHDVVHVTQHFGDLHDLLIGRAELDNVGLGEVEGGLRAANCRR